MLLCDIGNTSFHFFDGSREYKKSVSNFDPRSVKDKVYYISVNKSCNTLLDSLANWIDLSSHVDKESHYTTMGIDRIVSLHAVSHGVIIDAGSAITVDIMKDAKYEGGFIYPGVAAMQKSYKDISSALEYPFNFDIDLSAPVNSTQDAISYGFIKPLYMEVISHSLPIILTGGDAQKFKKIFPQARVDTLLLFSAMKSIIKE